MRVVLGVVLKSLKKALLLRVELWIVAILLSLATLGFDAFTSLYRWFVHDPPPSSVIYSPVPEQRFHGRDGLTWAGAESGEAGYPGGGGVSGRCAPGPFLGECR